MRHGDDADVGIGQEFGQRCQFRLAADERVAWVGRREIVNGELSMVAWFILNGRHINN